MKASLKLFLVVLVASSFLASADEKEEGNKTVVPPVIVNPWAPQSISEITEPQGEFSSTRAGRNGSLDYLRESALEPSPEGSPFQNNTLFEKVFQSEKGPIRISGLY